MFKGLGNLASIMKQAQEISSKMGVMQEQLAEIRAEGTAGGGMVTVEANGHQKLLGVRIEQSLLDDNDKEMLEDLVLAATNQALDKAKQAAAEQMKGLTGDADIPGLDDALEKFGLGGGSGGDTPAS
ncbi:MAG: YbaB/EbfC family nucleoid-associated protein [Planctomycetaceae bacterium]